MKAGLNLYSLRNHLADEKDFIDTLNTLKEAGYSFMQYSGGPFEWKKLLRVSEATGLPFVLTHVPYDRIVNDTDALMEEHGKIGCHNIGLGMMPVNMADVDLVKETVAKLEKTAAYMEQKGYHLFYHNHFHEFHKIDGETIFDYMIKNAPHLHFTVDTYWLQYGGMDICDFFEKVKGRMECLHLKDYKITSEFKPAYAHLGDGTLNFAKIIEKAKECGTQYFIVEQDNAAELENGIEEVCASIEYLKQWQ